MTAGDHDGGVGGRVCAISSQGFLKLNLTQLLDVLSTDEEVRRSTEIIASYARDAPHRSIKGCHLTLMGEGNRQINDQKARWAVQGLRGGMGSDLVRMAGEADINNEMDEYGQLEEADNNLAGEPREAWHSSRKRYFNLPKTMTP